MIILESRHFNLNRILLLAIGLWPYHRTKFVRFQNVLFFGIQISFIIFQLTTFLNSQLSIDFVTKILSITLLFTIFVIMYTAFWNDVDSIKCLLEHVQYANNEPKDEKEIAILKKYRFYGRRYTINITLLTACSLVIIFVQPFWPYVLNICPFINGSCYTLPVITEYFIDQEKYFYIILLHTDAAACIGLITMIATATLLQVCLKHACGMFRIASYRIEQAITNNKNINLLDEIFIRKRITDAVDIHRRAMQFAEIIIQGFERLFFLLIVFGVLCLTFNLYRVTSFGNVIDEIGVNCLCGCIIILYMFLTNYYAQEIIDHNEDVYHVAYNVRWYKAPLPVQRLILFLLQRSAKTFSPSIGRMFTPSLKCFASLASASVSYFTVIYSIQQ